jgi:predicted DNA repair protein MutK
MWTRIYLGVLAAAILVVGFFTYYSLGWLESIGKPEDAIAGYESTSGIASAMLSICSIVLVFMGVGVLWTTRRAWALWVTFAYFAVFRAVEGFYLSRGYQELVAKSSGLNPKVWATPVITLLVIIGAAAMTLVVQYVVVTMHAKFNPTHAIASSETDVPENESSRLM